MAERGLPGDQPGRQRMPYEPDWYFHQDFPGGFVPPGPLYQRTQIRNPNEDPWGHVGPGASLKDRSNAWLFDALFDYYQGSHRSPQQVLEYLRALREIYRLKEDPHYYLAPGLEDEVLRYMGYRLTPDGEIERIPEEGKPPLG